ncbi:DUF892 family protein [Candidatus Parcubacteria bacterium]|nr:DUF892 family protein [Candidatus Parcubacteria bacterium]
MKLNNLRDLFLMKLSALYDVETQIVKALPKVAKEANDMELKKSFEKHVVETKKHVERLDEIFTELGEKPQKVKVEAIRGMIEDTEWVIGQEPAPEALDAVLAASARYIEHYEMAGYLSLIAWAELLGEDDVAELLEATLEEERDADMALNEAAETKLGQKALLVEEEE